jgi:mannose/fructose/N-acetylgalactosamine-specific phosphotransferase system component IID
MNSKTTASILVGVGALGMGLYFAIINGWHYILVPQPLSRRDEVEWAYRTVLAELGIAALMGVAAVLCFFLIPKSFKYRWFIIGIYLIPPLWETFSFLYDQTLIPWK